jgi:murein DD-endopeptidase MepM/ murein hydrolase activator NlpD
VRGYDVGHGVRRAVRVAVVVLALVLVAPAALAEPDSVEEAERQLEETRERRGETEAEQRRRQAALESAQQDLHDITQQVEAAQSELAAVEVRLADAEAELARVEAELAEATEAHEAAVARTEEVTEELIAADAELKRTEAELEERIDVFDARVAATYKYGTITYAQVLVDSRDFEEFLTSFYYVRSAMGFDQVVIDEITTLTQELARQRAEVARLRDVAREEEAKAEEAREAVAALAEAQREATEHVADERDRQRQLTAQLESAREQHQAQVSALAAESQALEAELRELTELEGERQAQLERMRAERRRSGGSGGTASGGSSCQAGWTPNELAWPTNGCMTSGYGYRTHPIHGTRRLHTGIDIPAPTGQQIVTATDGYVVSAGWRGGYGLTVVVDHGGGIATLYAHMSDIWVSAGQLVSHAEGIGAVGSTGQSTGPHLHFEVRVNGDPRDPMDWYR